METKFLGIPLALWGLVCLGLAVVWIFVWPSDKAVAPDTLHYFILRWFHALTWLLLALAAFVAGFNILGGETTARGVALLSLLTYLTFMVTSVTSK